MDRVGVDRLANALCVTGLVVLAVGLAMAWLPAGVIMSGLELIGLSVVVGVRR